MLPAARSLATTVIVAGALGSAACGSDERTSEGAAEKRSTPATAIEEIGETRSALDQAVAAVRAGDRRKAHEILSEGYVEHFEEVEGPLGKVDAELTEELEESISGTLRDEAKSGTSAAAFEKTVADVKRDLATAEKKLG